MGRCRTDKERERERERERADEREAAFVISFKGAQCTITGRGDQNKVGCEKMNEAGRQAGRQASGGPLFLFL